MLQVVHRRAPEREVERRRNRGAATVSKSRCWTMCTQKSSSANLSTGPLSAAITASRRSTSDGG